MLSAILLNFIKEWKADKEEREASCQRQQEEMKAVKVALIEILGKQIEDNFYYHIEVGYISAEKLAQIHHLYEVYHKLGGNGTRTMEVQKLDELPNHPEHIGELRREKDN